MNAIACKRSDMSNHLLSEIDRFLKEFPMSDYRFGLRAARNGRLIERLRSGRRVWPETDSQVRAFMLAERQRRERITPKARAS